MTNSAGSWAEVSQTKTQQGGTIKVKFSDKQAALEKLGRALGMFGDRVVIAELMEEIGEQRQILDDRRGRDPRPSDGGGGEKTVALLREI